VTFKVCVKIHRIRFEPHPDDADRSGNSQPGTVVDKVIGDPFIYNFFLQSQVGVKGTSCPTRYILLHDETNYTVNDLQNIANSLCSGFQRATRSVQIEKFTHYANLVATRAKKWTCQMTMVLHFSQSTVELKPQVRDSMSLINSRIGSIRGMRRSSL
ncbi:Piwi domain-containing protein, partial [Phakopsora pachyrhizi]